MKRIEITLLFALTLGGALMSTLPSWPAAQPPTIVRMEPGALPAHADDRKVVETVSDDLEAQRRLHRLPSKLL